MVLLCMYCYAYNKIQTFKCLKTDFVFLIELDQLNYIVWQYTLMISSNLFFLARTVPRVTIFEGLTLFIPSFDLV